MGKTKIIATVGPSTNSKQKLKELILKGCDAIRINMRQCDYTFCDLVFQMVDELNKELNTYVSIILDTNGPDLRIGLINEDKTFLKQDTVIRIYKEDVLGDETKFSVNYEDFVNDVKIGNTISINDGAVELVTEEKCESYLKCRVVKEGFISSKSDVHVVGIKLNIPFLSEKDKEDIRFGIKQGFDFIAASFVRTADCIREIKEMLDAEGSAIKVIAKIENAEGIENLDEIIAVADGIMVARGDMGVEIPLEEVPILQKKMIKMAVAQGKHVITATQMLESMIKNPRPTRAEATDIANAIYDGTTAIMLSGESAAGLYPVEAVKTMSRIAERAEQDIDYRGRMQKVKEDRQETPDITTAISYATCSVASDLNAAAIITVTMSGFTANMIARYKPGCQIIGCTLDEKVYRQLNLLWGVKPVMIQKERTTDALFEEAVFKAKQAGLVKTGDTVVITAGVPLGVVGKTDMIHVVEVE